MRLAVGFLAALGLVLGTSMGHAQGAELRGRCFVFSYTEPIKADSTLFARMVRFSPQPDNDTLTTVGFLGDSIGFWRMFQHGGKYVTLKPDSLQLQFSNGFSFVTYNLHNAGDSLVGWASILYDFGPWDTIPGAKAVGRPCP
jgi:hypothetical protein